MRLPCDSGVMSSGRSPSVRADPESDLDGSHGCQLALQSGPSFGSIGSPCESLPKEWNLSLCMEVLPRSGPGFLPNPFPKRTLRRPRLVPATRADHHGRHDSRGSCARFWVRDLVPGCAIFPARGQVADDQPCRADYRIQARYDEVGHRIEGQEMIVGPMRAVTTSPTCGSTCIERVRERSHDASRADRERRAEPEGRRVG
jgi:hypothetical protein